MTKTISQQEILENMKQKIQTLHSKLHKKDLHSRRGLQHMINRYRNLVKNSSSK